MLTCTFLNLLSTSLLLSTSAHGSDIRGEDNLYEQARNGGRDGHSHAGYREEGQNGGDGPKG